MSVKKLNRYGLPFANVVPTGTATNNITPGRTIDRLRLKLSGTTLTKAMLTSIKLKANGKTIIEASGPQLDKINTYKGNAVDAGYLDIDFADPSMLSTFDREVSAFDSSVGIGSLTSEITIAGATAPVLTPILTESAQQKDRDGKALPYAPVMAKLLSYPFNIATGGKLPFSTPFGPQNGAVIKRVHVFHSGNMTGATVKENSLVIHESLRLENEFLQKTYGRVPQANVYTIDFVVDGNVENALNTRTASSLEWLFDFSAADNGTILVEYLDTLGNL